MNQSQNTPVKNSVLESAKHIARRTFLRHHHKMADVVDDFVAKSKVEYRPDFFSPEVQTRKHFVEAFTNLREDLHKRVVRHDEHVNEKKGFQTAFDRLTVASTIQRYEKLIREGAIAEKDKKFLALVLANQTGPVPTQKNFEVVTRIIQKNLDHTIKTLETSFKDETKKLNKLDGTPFKRLLSRLHKVDREFGTAEWNLGVNILHGTVDATTRVGVGLVLVAGYAMGHAGAAVHAVAAGVGEGVKEAVVTMTKSKFKSVFSK